MSGICWPRSPENTCCSITRTERLRWCMPTPAPANRRLATVKSCGQQDTGRRQGSAWVTVKGTCGRRLPRAPPCCRRCLYWRCARGPRRRLSGQEVKFIVVNCLLDASMRGLIGVHEFALMKPSAIFVNCARGPIVDEFALHSPWWNSGLLRRAWMCSTRSRCQPATRCYAWRTLSFHRMEICPKRWRQRLLTISTGTSTARCTRRRSACGRVQPISP